MIKKQLIQSFHINKTNYPQCLIKHSQSHIQIQVQTINNTAHSPIFSIRQLSMISQPQKTLPQLVAEMLQMTSEFRSTRERLHERIQRGDMPSCVQEFKDYAIKERRALQLTSKRIMNQMLEQVSQRQEIYDFQLQKMLNFVRNIYLSEYPKYQNVGPITKINKLSQKFLTSAYDFTDYQIMGLLLYSYTYDWSRIPNQHDFALFYRIIVKLTQFNHIDEGFQLAYEQIMMLVLVLYNHPTRGIDKFVSILRLMKKFQVVEISINTIKYYQLDGFLTTTLEIYDINMMLLNQISCKYVLKNIQNPVMLAQVLNEQDTKSVDTMTQLIIDQVPYFFQLMNIRNSFAVHKLIIEHFSSLSRLQRRSIPRIDFEQPKFKFEDISEKRKLNAFEQQFAGVLYDYKILNWISKRMQFWTQVKSLTFTFDLITILELIAFRISVSEFKEKLIPIVEVLLKKNLPLTLLDWFLEFVYENKKPQNAQLFRDIFIEKQLLSKILTLIQDPVQYLEENIDNFANINGFATGRFSKFIFMTILAIEICRACQIAPYNLIVKASEIILKLQLNCYSVNEFIETFLNENPLVPNEKMEIQA